MEIDPEFLEMLNTVLDESVQKYKNTTDKPIELFRMSFIKKFIEDIWLLNDLKMDNSCYKRTVYLILRNMMEQHERRWRYEKSYFFKGQFHSAQWSYWKTKMRYHFLAKDRIFKTL